ncbi:MAG: hypothetical protein AAF528_01175 [Cyanobacteria bacterium P01_C01_bin.121]
MKPLFVAAIALPLTLLSISCIPYAEVPEASESEPQEVVEELSPDEMSELAIADFRDAYGTALEQTGAEDIAFASGTIDNHALKVGVNLEPWQAMSAEDKTQWTQSIHTLWTAAYRAQFGDDARSPYLLIVDKDENTLADQGQGVPSVKN